MTRFKFILSVTLTLIMIFSLFTMGNDIKIGEYKRVAQDQILNVAKNEIIVKFQPGITEEERGILLRSIDASVKNKSYISDIVVCTIPERITIEDAISHLSSYSEIVYAEPNIIRRLHFSPNDPLYSYQWHFSNLNMEQAWDKVTGNAGVVVAVLDTGVAYENYNDFLKAPDLSGTSFVPGYDFIDNDSHANDEGANGFGHGTHVSGVIAQTTNNGYGVAGVAFGVTIMPIRVCSTRNGCPDSAIAQGIIWATDNGADIINMSLGGFGTSQILTNAVQYAYSNGVILVASSGNEADEGNYPGGIGHPAGYDQVLAVGATDYVDRRSSYSNFGDGLDVVAPGGDMNADQNSDGFGDGIMQQSFNGSYRDFGYWIADGTSFSAPMAAALAALLMSMDSSLKGNPELVYDIIRFSSIDLGDEGWDDEYGYGLINPLNAFIGLGLLD